MVKAGPWQKLMKEAQDAKSIMRIHALGLLCFADNIEDEVAEALKKGGHLTYTIQVSEPVRTEEGRADAKDNG